MAVHPIVLSDDMLIRKKSHKVRRVTPSVERLIGDMIDSMEEARGIGLAAIQIGVPERVIIVRRPESEDDPDSGKLYVVVNPQLARRSRETEEGVEGCLSVPGWAGEVSRHCAVTVKGRDRRGQTVRIKAEGLLARVFQHEIDHCDGILYIDHITDPEKMWSVPVGEEEAAEAAQEPRISGEAEGLRA
jgi:peptide deformylase